MQEDKEKWTEEALLDHTLIKAANHYSYIYGKRQIYELILLLCFFAYVAYDDISIIIELAQIDIKYEEYMNACMVFDIMTWGTVIFLKFLINLRLYDYSLEVIGFICFVCTVFNLFFGLTSADLMRSKSFEDQSLKESI
jgi:hypothetical protein